MPGDIQSDLTRLTGSNDSTVSMSESSDIASLLSAIEFFCEVLDLGFGSCYLSSDVSYSIIQCHPVCAL
jgi:hypothetical protein